MGIWGLSESLVEAIAFHHCPGKCSNLSFGTLGIIHLANSAEHCEHGKKSTKRLDLSYLEELEIGDRLTANYIIKSDSIQQVMSHAY